MQIRLKTKQTVRECNAYRCQKLPKGQYLDVGYLCHSHGEKVTKARERGDAITTIGAPPKFGNGTPETHTLELEPEVEIETPVGLARIPVADFKEELTREREELEDALEEIRGFDLLSDDDVAFATQELATTKGQWRRWEEKRKEISAPLNQALRAANGLFRPMLSLLSETEALWKTKLVELKQRRAVEQQKLLDLARASDDAGDIRDALVQASETTLEPEGVGFRDNWVFEIEDPEKLPRKFLMPDERAISGVVKALKDSTDIPGVRVWNAPIVSSRSQ